MKKKIKKISIILLVILISIFVGYEHPGLVEVPKKYVYFLLKKVGLKESALDKTINKETIKNVSKIGVTSSTTGISLTFSEYSNRIGKILNKKGKITNLFAWIILYTKMLNLN